MLRPSPGRLLLLLPTATYRATAFVEAARRLGVELTVASELPSTFEQVQPAGLVTLDFSDPERAAQQAAEFARRHPIAGVIGVDDDGAVVAAAIAERLALKGNPPAAALAPRDKHPQRRGAPPPRGPRAPVRPPKHHPGAAQPAPRGAHPPPAKTPPPPPPPA